MDSYKTIRQAYPVFRYDNYQIEQDDDALLIRYDYSVGDNDHFVSQVKILNVPFSKWNNNIPEHIKNAVFHLGLVELLSYWKSYLSPTIEIRPHFLDDKQLSFWKSLLLNGFGEFFYVNQIDFQVDDFITFVSSGTTTLPISTSPKIHRNLVPVGGGKDSALTLALLEETNEKFCSLALNPSQATKLVVDVGKQNELITIERSLDPALLERNRQGHLNGHTPFSAYLAFLSVLIAEVFDFDTILLSNERSAEEHNLMYLHTPINHQFSKSFQFEIMFREYCQTYLSSQVTYSSFLRPLFEIQIAELFSHFPEYFPMILSCNRGASTQQWCCQCPKCMSTYISLFPFLGEDVLQTIFPIKMFTDELLWPRIQELIDPSIPRPFECVGTREESLIGLYLACDWYLKSEKSLPALLSRVKQEYLSKEVRLVERSQSLRSAWSEKHTLRSEYIQLLQQKLRAL